MKIDVPAIPFARAWEAVIKASGKDKNRTNTYRVIVLEHFKEHGIRLISTDGYLAARAWIPINVAEDALEPDVNEPVDESFAIVDGDHRGLGLLQHARNTMKKNWQFKRKDEQPDTSPRIQIETRAPERDQGTLEGMEAELFFIDFPEHELVALSVLHAETPDWRTSERDAKAAPIGSLQLGIDQLKSVTQIASVYDGFPVVWTFHESGETVAVEIGPIRAVMKTAPAIQAAQAQDKANRRYEEEKLIEAAYDDGEESAGPEE